MRYVPGFHFYAEQSGWVRGVRGMRKCVGCGTPRWSDDATWRAYIANFCSFCSTWSSYLFVLHRMNCGYLVDTIQFSTDIDQLVLQDNALSLRLSRIETFRWRLKIPRNMKIVIMHTSRNKTPTQHNPHTHTPSIQNTHMSASTNSSITSFCAIHKYIVVDKCMNSFYKIINDLVIKRVARSFLCAGMYPHTMDSFSF